MSIISWKDYFFSLRRGSTIESFQIIVSYLVKSIVFRFFGVIHFFKKQNKLEISRISNIAIYFPANTGLGDLILCDFFFKSVRELFPKAKIFIYSKNGQFINPSFYDELIDNSKIDLKSQIKSINLNKIDLFLLPEKSIKGSKVFLSCTAKFKIGYLDSYQLRANFKFKSFIFIPHQTPYHVKSYSIIRSLFPDLQGITPLFTPDLSFLKTEPPNNSNEYILFIPCVSWGNRTISFENAKIVLDTVLKNGYTVYLSGGGESIKTNAELIKLYKNDYGRIICNDLLNLPEFVNVVKNSKAVICGDSGPLYMSFGFKKPVLSFWGPTFPELKINSNNKNETNAIYEKEQCQVINCYNMENKPFCKTCLRLDHIPDLEKKVTTFLKTLN